MIVNNFEGSFSTFSFTTRAYINSESLPNRSLFYFGVEAGGDNSYTRSVDLTINNDNELRVNLNYDYGQIGTQDYTTDAWVDIAGVFDNGQLSLYIDGNQVGSTQASVNSINLENTDPNNFIGAGFSGGQQSIANFFDGQIDNLAFWGIALDDDQINYYRDSDMTGEEEGLVSYWSFNYGSGDIAYDHTGNQKHGAVNGASWNLLPVSGGNNSLSFDGTDDYAFVSELSSAVDNSNLTLMGWFKSTSNGEPNIYFEGIFGFRNYPSGDGNFFANMNWLGWTDVPTIECYGGVPGNIPLTPNDDTWYHLALVYDNDNGVFSTYLDGVQMASNTPNNDPMVPSIDLLIGNNIQNGDHFFQGYIDDISLWSGTLTEQQIQSYMYTPPSNDEPELVGYWNFNEGEGDALADVSGNGNDGNINGATWSGDVPIPPVFGCTDTYDLSLIHI